VDMTKIVSMPQDRLMRGGKELLHLPGGNLFQVNVRGHASDGKVSPMLDDLQQACTKENTELRIAGSYKMVRLADYRA
jgi:prephenate dehydratase